MNRPLWLSYLYALAALSFAFFCASAGWRVWQVGGALKAAIAAYEPAGKSASELTERVNKQADEEFLRNLKNYAYSSGDNAQMIAQSYKNVGDATVVWTEKHLMPATDKIVNRADEVLSRLANVAAEGERQIKQNGDSANKILERSYDVVVNSEAELMETLKALRISGQNIQILTDSEHLQKTIEELNQTSVNATITTSNIASITSDIKGVSDKFLKPIYQPQKRTLLGKIGAGIKYGIRLISGGGNLLVLVDKLQ